MFSSVLVRILALKIYELQQIVAKGRKVSQGVRALVVPGSQQVKKQAEQEGLDKVFTEAGFEWRDAGCSMCLSMNNDVVPAGEHCASTSNRNFEGRQGTGARTHLVSPEMAADAAIYGKFVDVRKVSNKVVNKGGKKMSGFKTLIRKSSCP